MNTSSKVIVLSATAASAVVAALSGLFSTEALVSSYAAFGVAVITLSDYLKPQRRLALAPSSAALLALAGSANESRRLAA